MYGFQENYLRITLFLLGNIDLFTYGAIFSHLRSLVIP